ncbi:MAG: phosphotransferase [Nitrospirota bacterium]
MNVSAFILAAGLGKRLRPVTDLIPKPLLPLLGTPVLERILEKISALPVTNIGINLHHKKPLLEKWIAESPFNKMLVCFPEDPILGTGGALKNAGGFLKQSAFLVHNGDIVSDIDLEKLFAFHLNSGNLATLAVHTHPEFNRLEVNGDGILTGFISCRKWAEGGWKPAAFTGIAVYEPDFLQFLPDGVSSVVDAWFRAIDAGNRIGTFDVSGSSWSDIGTPASYVRTLFQELRKNGESVYIHPSAKNCADAAMDGYVVIESQAVLRRGISLRNCVLLPETTFHGVQQDATAYASAPESGGEILENCILGSGFRLNFSEEEVFGISGEEAILTGTGGSDRQYYRIRKNGRTEILMQCSEHDPDFLRHIEYTRFFRKYSVPVPALIREHADGKSATFEDLGDLSLYSWLRCPRSREKIDTVYRKAIDILVLLHTSVTGHVAECPPLLERVFDYGHLRWETTYFLERYVAGIRNIRLRNLSALNEELHRLALITDSFPKTVIHRDFQSQNIMITPGDVPGLLDYQGARVGPPAYDVVSLLWDPYYRLDEVVRESLLDYYIQKGYSSSPDGENDSRGTAGYLRVISQDEATRELSESEFRESLLSCRLQRHMQALGAYGFLSAVKGKNYFLKYIPEGLRLLKQDAMPVKDEYPRLWELITQVL